MQKKKREPCYVEHIINDQIQALRGLKGKPGTVNPADLTILTRKQALNNVELVYINTDTTFIGCVYIIERTPVSRLIQTMLETRVLPKEQVLQKCEYGCKNGFDS